MIQLSYLLDTRQAVTRTTGHRRLRQPSRIARRRIVCDIGSSVLADVRVASATRACIDIYHVCMNVWSVLYYGYVQLFDPCMLVTHPLVEQ